VNVSVFYLIENSSSITYPRSSDRWLSPGIQDMWHYWTIEIIFSVLEHSSSSSSCNRVRDSGYDTTTSNIEQQRFLPPASPSNVSLSPDGQFITVTYFSSPIPSHLDSSSSNTIPRTLKTFSQMPVTNALGNDSSTMMNACLAEQEIIEVW